MYDQNSYFIFLYTLQRCILGILFLVRIYKPLKQINEPLGVAINQLCINVKVGGFFYEHRGRNSIKSYFTIVITLLFITNTLVMDY